MNCPSRRSIAISQTGRSHGAGPQVPVIRLQHTGDSAAGSAWALWLQDTVTDELPEPQIHSHFADWAQPRGRAGR